MSTTILRLHGAEEAPQPDRTDLSFAQVPHAATADTRISDAEHRVFSAVLFFTRSSGRTDATDEQIGARCGKEARTVNRLVSRLVRAGWLTRSTAGPFRTLALNHSLARPPEVATKVVRTGNQDVAAKDATSGDQGRRKRGACTPDAADVLTKGQEKKSDKPAGGKAAGVAAPAGGKAPPPRPAPPPPSPEAEPPPTDAELDTWRDAVSDPTNPFGGFAYDVLEQHDPGFLEARGIRERPRWRRGGGGKPGRRVSRQRPPAAGEEPRP